MQEDRDDPDTALALHAAAEGLCRQLQDPAGLQASLLAQARIRGQRGEHEWAGHLYRQAESICRRLGNPQWLAQALAAQAMFLAEDLRRPPDALPLAQEAWQLAVDYELLRLQDELRPLLDSLGIAQQ